MLQEARLLQTDCVMRYVSWNLINCSATVQKSPICNSFP